LKMESITVLTFLRPTGGAEDSQRIGRWSVQI
jgi:hypothetical protein